MTQIPVLDKPSFVPANDTLRLSALHRYQIVNSPPEKTFEEITALLADTFDVSMAFVSLVAEHSVFFKSKIGSGISREVPRGTSFCALSILNDGVTVFEDTEMSGIDDAYPDFTAPNGIRFYAGSPIVTEDGFAIGTVCIADSKPRLFSAKEKKLLQQFARLAMKEMENRRSTLEYTRVLEAQVVEAVQKLKKYESESQAFNLYSQAPVAIALYMGEELVIRFVNETALKISGKTPDIIGKRLVEVLPEVESQGYIDLMKYVFKTGETYKATEAPVTLMINGQPKEYFFNFIYQPYFNSLGEIDGVLAFGVDLTQQVQTRKAIEASEQKFKNVLDQAPYPILILKGEDLVLEVANPPLLRLWNINETSIGLPFLQILPEMKEQGFWDLLQKVYKEGYVHYGYETPAYFLRDGEKKLHYFNFVYHPYTEKDGTISGVLVLATDITEQVLAKQKVAESESHFRSLILQAPVGICILYRDRLRVEIANTSYAEIVGLPRAAFEGRPITEILPIASQYEPILYRVLDTGEPFYAHEYAIEVERNGKNDLLYVDFVYEPLRENDGTINRVMALVIDVTEKVKARQQIETVEARTRLAVESAELGTFDVDLTTNKVFENQRLREIFDVTDGDDRGAYVKVIHPDDLPLREAAYKKAFENGVLEYEVRVRHRNQSFRWVKVKGSILFSENRVPVRLHGVVLDITEQKQFAEELSRQVAERTEELTYANKLLTRKNEELDQFAYVASHDLREPLRKILIFSNIIEERYAVPEEVHSYLDKITAAAERMNGLIKSLLDFSRLSLPEERFSSTDLNQVLEQVKGDFEVLIEQKKAVINSTRLAVIQCIPLQLNQLFFNLIGNALKFSHPGIPPVVTITGELLTEKEQQQWAALKPESQYYKIVFSDNGIGFNQEYASKIFTIFQRLNERFQYSGYGIGLALCKKIADNHSGLIFANGQPRSGASFTVILPLSH